MGQGARSVGFAERVDLWHWYLLGLCSARPCPGFGHREAGRPAGPAGTGGVAGVGGSGSREAHSVYSKSWRAVLVRMLQD